MARFCASCGVALEDGVNFCAACGANINGSVVGTVQAMPLSGPSLKKDNQKTFWIAALIAQVVCIILFLLPTVRLTLCIPEEYASELGLSKINTLSYSISDNYLGDSDEGFQQQEITQQKSGDVDVLEGDFKLMNVIDLFGTEAYHTILLFTVLIALVLFAAPLVKKEKLRPQAALWMLLAQGAFFVVNIITLLVLKGKPETLIKRFADMVVIYDIPSSVLNELCDLMEKFCKYGFNAMGWIYIVFSVVSIALLGKIVYDNRVELFPKKPEKTLNNEVAEQ